MDFFGINGSELLLILVVGVIVVGPARAAQGILWLKKALERARAWSARLREETTVTEAGLKVDLSAFDPRQYDPRRLIKEAVAEEMEAWIETSKSIKEGAVALGQSGTTPQRTVQAVPAPETPMTDTPAEVGLTPETGERGLLPATDINPRGLASLELFETQLKALEEQKQVRVKAEVRGENSYEESHDAESNT